MIQFLILFFFYVTYALPPIPKEIVFPTQPPGGLQVTFAGCRQADGCDVKARIELLVPYFNTVASFFRPKMAIALLKQGAKMKSLDDLPPEEVTIPEEPPEGSGLTVKPDACSADAGCDVKNRNLMIGKYFNILASHFSAMIPATGGPHNTAAPMPVQSVNIPMKKLDQAKLTAQHKLDIRKMLDDQNKQLFDKQKPMFQGMFQSLSSQQLAEDPYHKYINKVIGLEERRQSMFSNYLRTRNDPPHFEDFYDQPTVAPRTGNPDDHMIETFGGSYFTADGYKIMKKRFLENEGLKGYDKSAFKPTIKQALITK
ncbi:hypothetical protein EIN_057080 [Entamoeba invadens IP1]|uniref:Uncharacterized protein n=1 Tax=Entamoeba invadens TaxID=33085 RepID=S0B4F2_ENTIV|nr:hypothetical protein EIN_057080 [Entamoeba invadens IP1]ELP93323.1 hypothetical protein EIN_057080 [Entamoeba invadens IP1]BAN42104.1 hypothetical protein [Entamoeba invadens]|eukprot:XP_004260094.1 hypothetical protein EIN_057080 [Entamoeba invadens IP1]